MRKLLPLLLLAGCEGPTHPNSYLQEEHAVLSVVLAMNGIESPEMSFRLAVRPLREVRGVCVSDTCLGFCSWSPFGGCGTIVLPEVPKDGRCGQTEKGRVKSEWARVAIHELAHDAGMEHGFKMYKYVDQAYDVYRGLGHCEEGDK